MGDDNRMAAHPMLMLVLQEGLLWCISLRWPKIFQGLVWRCTKGSFIPQQCPAAQTNDREVP